MAAVEKICEFDPEEHCYNPDTYKHYMNNPQVCGIHRPLLTKASLGRKHKIIVFPGTRTPRFHSMKGCEVFVLIIGGITNPETEDNYFMYYFDDKRKFRRNMKKLLGVTRLNVKRSRITYDQWWHIEEEMRNG